MKNKYQEQIQDYYFNKGLGSGLAVCFFVSFVWYTLFGKPIYILGTASMGILALVILIVCERDKPNRKVFKGSNHNHSKDNNRVLGVNSP